ncbi:AN1-type zinc finger protein 2A [Onthophagus taurus]|uniref:AN1-type zinc finger protein 2A n=1 Tax=Onthophagus taurus TaxID=166361 RepID=UPI000C20D1FC|nr:AN1-type zinc finger protein 2A-like [Onthophagus taurus]
MELPSLGNHCSNKSCNKLDFLPIKCDACGQIFCNEHYNYLTHNCPESYKKNNQVPVCPLCNIPIPVGGKLPDVAVSAHIDSDCQSDPAKNRRKVFTNKCTRKGCKVKEVIRVICEDCKMNYCLKHRHPIDHDCKGKSTIKTMAGNAAVTRQNIHRQKNHIQTNTMSITKAVHGTMTEDEALARALALSLEDSNNPRMTQEEIDLALARQLQASESETQVGGVRNSTRDRCSLS